MTSADPRSSVPRTDRLLADPRLVAATARLGRAVVKAAVGAAQAQVRAGKVPPEAAADAALSALPRMASSLQPVLNATGVVLHTNLGRASLSPAAIEAVVAAGSYVDVEYDVASGVRAARGRGTLSALRKAVPAAGDVLVVNNGAAALVLATTALAARREVIVSRGELIEIGDGFRLPDLIESAGAKLCEVGTTNRTSLQDYSAALSPATACVLKIHPSNFRVEGFTSAVSISDVATLGVPVVADVGSGLLAPDALLPEEPDVATALAAGATLVTCSGDKLLGGPQAGLIFGRADIVAQLRCHPLARALRVDKLTLAALEATLVGPQPPTWQYLHADLDVLRSRTEHLASVVGGEVVPTVGAVGGGGAPGLKLQGVALALPARYANALRRGQPCVVTRIEHGCCLIDLRCVPAAEDARLRDAVLAASI